MKREGNLASCASSSSYEVEDLVRQLQAHGVTFKVEGTRLTAGGAAEVLTPSVVTELRQHKSRLLRLLAKRCEVSTPAVCGWCGGVLAPFLIDLAGKPALLCPMCKRWTVTAEV